MYIKKKENVHTEERERNVHEVNKKNIEINF